MFRAVIKYQSFRRLSLMDLRLWEVLPIISEDMPYES